MNEALKAFLKTLLLALSALAGSWIGNLNF